MEYVWLITHALAHHLLRALRHQSLVKGASAVKVDPHSVALRVQMVQDVAMKKVKQKKKNKTDAAVKVKSSAAERNIRNHAAKEKEKWRKRSASTVKLSMRSASEATGEGAL